MKVSLHDGSRVLADTNEVPDRLQTRDHLLHPGSHGFMIDQGAAFGLIHHVNVVGRTQEHGQRHTDTPAFRDGNFTEDVFGAVCHQKGNRVSLLQAEFLKCVYEAVGFVSHFFVCIGLIVVCDGNLGSVVIHTTIIQLADGPCDHGLARPSILRCCLTP